MKKVILSIFLIAIFVSCDKSTESESPPVADFSVDKTSGGAPLVVSFTDISTSEGSKITSWQWNFGDGKTSQLRNTYHTYDTAGSFSVSLTVSSDAGSDIVTKTNLIQVTSSGPTADFSATPTSGLAPLTVSFADATSAGSKPITSRLWQFGDGSTSSQVNPSHTYSSSGVFTVSLTVNTSVGSNTETKVNYINVSENPQLTVSTNQLDYATNLTSLTFDIQNNSSGTLSWQLSKDSTWLSVSPATGTTTTEADIVTVQVNRSGLSCGSYTDTLHVTSNGGNDQVIVTMEVSTSPQIIVNSEAFDFGLSETSKLLEIQNAGCSELNWLISGGDDWLTINPSSGTTNSETDDVNLTVDRSFLSPGLYTDTFHINTNGGNKHIEITMQVPCGLEVTEPTYTDSWYVGDVEDIEWTAVSGQYVVIDLYQNGSKRCTLEPQYLNTGVYHWTVTDCNGGSAGNYQIRIANYDASTCYDISDQFTITSEITDTAIAIADAFVVGSDPDDNTSALDDLLVGWLSTTYEVTYIKFDISIIPVNATIESAYIMLYCEANVGDFSAMKGVRVTSNWSEGSITYNNQPSSTSSGQHSWLIPSQTFIYHKLNVTNIVKSWIEDGTINYGLALATNAFGSTYNWVHYSSREASHKPMLEITYQQTK